MPETDKGHTQSIAVSALRLEVYRINADTALLTPILAALEATCASYLKTAAAEGVLDACGLAADGSQAWEVDVNFVDNAGIRAMNKQYRGKDEATDVLSFPLLNEEMALPNIPEVQLGSIFISLEWAKAHAPSQQAVTAYALERFVHGLLHLMGQNHDTMEDYRKVKAIQADVLAAAGLSP